MKHATIINKAEAASDKTSSSGGREQGFISIKKRRRKGHAVVIRNLRVRRSGDTQKPADFLLSKFYSFVSFRVTRAEKVRGCSNGKRNRALSRMRAMRALQRVFPYYSHRRASV